MDFTHWCPLARPSPPLSAASNLSSDLSKMGEKRCVFDHFRSLSRGFTPTRRPGFIRVFHRRHLCAGKKGGLGVGKTKRGKGTKIMALADGAGLPLAIYLASASPHEVTLVEDTLANRFVAKIPRRIIGDKAYDSDPLDQILEGQGIEMIAPHRSNRKKPKTQDGRVLRRYKRRWKIERLFAWLFNFRRLLVRHEYYSENFLAFVSLGCIKILIRYF